MVKEKKALLLDGGTCHPNGNKGDELMLYAVLQALDGFCDRFDFVSRIDSGPYIERAKRGLHQLLWERRRTRLAGWFGYPAFRRYGRPFGIVADEDLYAVINFMGYRYADIGAREIHADNRRNRQRRSRGTKLIFLPQAYGPFSTAEVRRDAAELFNNSDLIFARDRRSAQYLEILGINREVLISPDITIPIRGIEPNYVLPAEFVTIVPNRWMKERVSKDIAESYLGFLRAVIDWAQRSGLPVIVLAHAEFQDGEIAEALVGGPGRAAEVRVVYEYDALRAKGLIGRASLVVGSRYHALVAGLSQNIPTIGTAWAHKYPGLFEDYRCLENLVKPTIGRDDLFKQLDCLMSERSRAELTDVLMACNERMFAEVREMWACALSEL